MYHFRGHMETLICPVAVAGATAMVTQMLPVKAEKVKRVCLYRLPKEVNLEALNEAVAAFDDLGGIKATFHASDGELLEEFPQNKKHTHCLLLIASDKDSFKDFMSSKEHKTFAQQLLAAGCDPNDTATHDSPLTVIRC